MFRATSHHHRPILAPPVDGELHEPNIPQGAHVSPPPWAAMMIISLIWTTYIYLYLYKHLWYPMVILLIMSYRYILFLWSWSYIVSLSNDDYSLWNDRSWPSWPWGERKRNRILNNQWFQWIHGSLNVPIEHHPTIRYMVYNGYYKVMSNIPKMGHLPTPGIDRQKLGYFHFFSDINGLSTGQLQPVYPSAN